MPALLTYLLKLSLSLGIVFLFYQLVLRKLTFYTWNRWYLFGYSILSFFIPFINISPVLHRNEWSNNTIVGWVPTIGDQTIEASSGNSFSFSALNIAMVLFLTGMIIILVRLIVQLLSFRRMMKKAKFISGEGMKIYQVDEEIIPFSFGNAIFINRHLHTTVELQEIIRHEFVHVKQKHSMDIIWAELLCLFNWYNPFAWLIKRSIRQNLEFIADYKVLENGIDKKQYQYLLLKVIGNNQFSIAQKFNFSSLKKRIAMMNKNKTTRLHLVKFLFMLPLLAIILVSFRKQIGDTLTRKQKDTISVVPGVPTDTVPAVAETNSKGYYINIIGNKGNRTVVVKGKDKKEVKRILLSEWNDKEDYYENLYGEILPPLPPVPPLAPLQPARGLNAVQPIDAVPPVPPLQPAQGLNAIQPIGAVPPVAPLPPVPPVKASDKLNRACNDFEITETKAILKLKNGTIEKYDLKDPEQKAVFESKYGRIISSRANTSVDIATVAVVNGSGQTVIAPMTYTSASGKGQAAVAPMTYTSGGAKGQTVVADMAYTPAGVNGETMTAPATYVHAGSGGAVIASDNGDIITGKEDILITITRKTTPEQLEQYVKQMKEKGIELKFDEPEYKNGILIHLSGTMKYKDSQSVFSGTDFSKLILAMIDDGDRVWFKVSSIDNKKIVM